MPISRAPHRLLRAATGCAVGVLALVGVGVRLSIASAAEAPPNAVTISSTGLKPGAIKHVWLIILENKSYDATFTGLNQNSYLWKTLPGQGVLLKNYYGTGHSSRTTTSRWCPGRRPGGHPGGLQRRRQPDRHELRHHQPAIVTDKNFGQAALAANAAQPSGANAPLGQNGCTYPTDVPTLFNQLNAAGESWKGYAQDLGGAQTPGSTRSCRHGAGPRGRHLRRTRHSGQQPDTNPTSMSPSRLPGTRRAPASPAAPGERPVRGQALPVPVVRVPDRHGQRDGPAHAGADQAGPTAGPNCDANHIANLDSPTNGLFARPAEGRTTPAFSWITPEQLQRRPRRDLQGQQPVRRVQRRRHADLPDSPTRLDPESTTPEELHRRPVRLRPVPGVLHPDDRAVAGVQGRRPDRHHLR